MNEHCCFFCDHIQPRRIGENFHFVCNRSGKRTEAESACADFTPEVKRTKGTPPAVRQGAKVGGKNYTTKEG